MADLDNFFRKKDKKKTKKPKYVKTEDLMKTLEAATREAAQKTEKTEKTENAATVVEEEDVNATVSVAKETNQETTTNTNTTTTVIEENTDDEWLDYNNDENVRDYSGLKISQLKFGDDNETKDNSNEKKRIENSGQNTQEHYVRSGPNGPWKAVSASGEQEKQKEITTTTTATAKPALIKPTEKFVPSALRNIAPIVVRQNKTAPDISSAEFFPTLGAARPEEQRKKKIEPAMPGFAEVRHGGRVQRIQPQVVRAPSPGANRFESLGDNDY